MQGGQVWPKGISNTPPDQGENKPEQTQPAPEDKEQAHQSPSGRQEPAESQSQQAPPESGDGDPPASPPAAPALPPPDHRNLLPLSLEDQSGESLEMSARRAPGKVLGALTLAGVTARCLEWEEWPAHGTPGKRWSLTQTS